MDLYYIYGDLVCRIPDFSHATVYAYGIRNAARDIIGFEELIKILSILLFLIVEDVVAVLRGFLIN